MKDQIKRKCISNKIKLLSSAKDSHYNTDNAFKIKCHKILDIYGKDPNNTSRIEFCCKPMHPNTMPNIEQD